MARLLCLFAARFGGLFPPSHCHPLPLLHHHTDFTHALCRIATFASRDLPVALYIGPLTFPSVCRSCQGRLLPPLRGLSQREWERGEARCGKVVGWIKDKASRAQSVKDGRAAAIAAAGGGMAARAEGPPAARRGGSRTRPRTRIWTRWVLGNLRPATIKHSKPE